MQTHSMLACRRASECTCAVSPCVRCCLCTFKVAGPCVQSCGVFVEVGTVTFVARAAHAVAAAVPREACADACKEYSRCVGCEDSIQQARARAGQRLRTATTAVQHCACVSAVRDGGLLQHNFTIVRDASYTATLGPGGKLLNTVRTPVL